jgi:hypothetical protein
VRDSSRLHMDMGGNTGIEVVGEAEAGVDGSAPLQRHRREDRLHRRGSPVGVVVGLWLYPTLPSHHLVSAFADTAFCFTICDIATGGP